MTNPEKKPFIVYCYRVVSDTRREKNKIPANSQSEAFRIVEQLTATGQYNSFQIYQRRIK
jgi:hypothetical protein